MFNYVEKKAEGFVDFFQSKGFLVLMTLLVAMCSSSFAWQYGTGFDWRYGLLFGVALAALTFHYSRFIWTWLIKGMQWVTIVGLMAFTIFVSSAAWLSVATNKSDPELVAVQERIDQIKSDISTNKVESAALLASGNPVNARRKSDERKDMRKELNKAMKEKAKIQSKRGTYDVGAMAIFGHISKTTGIAQEKVNLIITWSLLFVLICMEITMGHAATSNGINRVSTQNSVSSTQNSVLNGPNSTENDKESTENDKTSTETPPSRKGEKSDKYRTKMRTVIVNRSVPDLKYETLTSKCGGSKNTAREVLEELQKSGVVKKDGRKWRYTA